MKNIIFSLFVALCLSSCGVNSYVQVATIASNNIVYEDKVFAYSDGNVIIDYSFNTVSGVFMFSVVNISDSDITIELEKTVFTYNGRVFDYAGRECDIAVATSGVFVSSGVLYNSVAVVDGGESPVHMLIPSGCYRLFEGFDINNTIYRQLFFARDPKKGEDIRVTFNEEDSPCRFANVVCYTIDGQEHRVQNDFYIREYRNLPVCPGSDYIWGRNEYYVEYDRNSIHILSPDYGIRCDDRTAHSSDLVE